MKLRIRKTTSKKKRKSLARKPLYPGHYFVYKKYKGRPSILDTNPEIQEEICKLLLDGLPIDKCCALVGIDPTTYQRWKNQAKMYRSDPERHKDYAKYDRFYTEVEKSIAAWQLNIVKRSFGDRPSITTWVRDMTILERRDRKNWSRQEVIVQKGEEEYNPDETFL